MKILLHDYCGHPFQIQLSRWLAQQGHQVRHCYSKDIESPHGDLVSPLDGLEVEALSLGRPVPKYDLVRRVLQERRYAALAAARVTAFGPDIVLSGNAPPTIQAALQHAAHQGGGAFVYWLQDIYSAVLERVLPSRIPVAGGLVAKAFKRYEFAVMAKSDAVVVISEDFVGRCEAAGIDRARMRIQRNWAPLSEIVPRPRDNAWAREQGLADKFVFLFSGTLGLKHNPGLISALAEAMRGRDDVAVAVISQGVGRRWLEDEKARKELGNLHLLDFQPFERLSDVLASADVLVAVLEPFAGELSVPSKILSYLCAERPLLAALPPENLASRIIAEAGAGKVVSALDGEAFVAAAQDLLAQPELRQNCAAAGRAYAEAHFDIDRIGANFLALFREAIAAR